MHTLTRATARFEHCTTLLQALRSFVAAAHRLPYCAKCKRVFFQYAASFICYTSPVKYLAAVAAATLTAAIASTAYSSLHIITQCCCMFYVPGWRVHAGKPLDFIFACVGGGGLVAGIAAYVKAVRPGVRIIGVEAEDAAGMTTSLHAGR